MSENIGGNNLLGSGGHMWQWTALAIMRKSVRSAGLIGEFGMTTAVGARHGMIVGRGGQPAMVCGAGSSRTAADEALTAIENVIEWLAVWGLEWGWEDDQGHSGTALVVLDYTRLGPRVYGYAGGTAEAWQFYRLTFKEMNGGW